MNNDDLLIPCTSCKLFKTKDEFLLKKKAYHGTSRVYSWECLICLDKNIKFNKYWNKLFKKFKTICKICGMPSKLDKDGFCKKCLRNQGLKYCSKCKEKKIINLDFYKKRAKCINCTTDNKKNKYNEYLLKNYDITLSDFNEMIEALGGICAICNSNENLIVDLNKIRKLICQKCNIGIQNLNNIILLQKAIEYVKNHG